MQLSPVAVIFIIFDDVSIRSTCATHLRKQSDYMKDRFGRMIDYMRISITDRCNLHCSYCRPEIPEHLDQSELLSYGEILRVCRAAVRLGITKFKITGGEPFVRNGVTGFIGKLASVCGVTSVTVTTNATLLTPDVVTELKKSGLDGINISLDTINPDKYCMITGADYSNKVMENIDLCYRAGLNVKINTVMLNDLSEYEILTLAKLAENRDISVRFIEKMPMGATGDTGPSGQYVKDVLAGHGIKLIPETERIGNGPAVYFRPEGYKGHIGFIEAIHGKFCSSCNRIRMTSTGFVKPCLYYSDGLDIRRLLRNGADDKEISEKLRDIIYMKPGSHNFEGGPSSENMSTIGG